ncbi:MAG: exonuclease SbcCD subunit D [Actinomycetes bacterium]|jgi:exonuclease SbcD
MRILHTSDWHIGRKFNEVDLLGDQAVFGDWLLSFVANEAIDVVLVSGDIFDQATPRADAVRLAGEIFDRLGALGTKVAIISGNHDSAERLNFVAGITAKAGLHIITERRVLREVTGPVTFVDGEGNSVQILAVPYLEPTRLIETDGAVATHQGVIEKALENGRSQLVDPARTIVMAHAFVAGGGVETADDMSSESERTLAVGGSALVNPKIFSDFGYVALGHLHRPQTVGSEHVVYSGSPLSYSFSEEHDKSVRVITVDKKILSEVVPIDVGRKVRTLTDTLDNLLKNTKYESAKDAFVRARLTDVDLQLGAMDRLQKRFPFTLLVEQSENRSEQALSVLIDPVTGEKRSPEDVVADYVSETFGDTADDALRAFINEGINAALAMEDSL